MTSHHCISVAPRSIPHSSFTPSQTSAMPPEHRRVVVDFYSPALELKGPWTRRRDRSAPIGELMYATQPGDYQAKLQFDGVLISQGFCQPPRTGRTGGALFNCAIDDIPLLKPDYGQRAHDPHVAFTRGDWQNLQAPNGGTASVATEPGSTFTMVFTGRKVAWVGWRPPGYPTGRSNAIYIIDNGSPVTFPLEPGGVSWELLLFEADVAPNVPHNLTVDGNFRIDANVPALPSSSPSPGELPPSPRRVPVASIVGGVFGGLAGILLVFWLLMRGKKKSGQLSDRTISSTMTPFDTAAQPHIQTSHVRKGQRLLLATIAPPQPHTFRKQQRPMSVAQAEQAPEINEEPLQHRDSGSRLENSSLPPAYTAV
ncbi:hypothetical protein BKA70DRAFT_1567849 [Coprinopsis sp. MPI-PUGE-AT-0042]|nr:hypothetical protein BKA70DRAFT_1567849 [Coprinopsis sp. MPI-PUGE-AT-0042]